MPRISKKLSTLSNREPIAQFDKGLRRYALGLI
jgi:hypothetical protein